MSEYEPQRGDWVVAETKPFKVIRVHAKYVAGNQEDGTFRSPSRDISTFRKVDPPKPPLPTMPGSTIYCENTRIRFFLTDKGWIDTHGTSVPAPRDDLHCIHRVFDAGAEL